MALEISLKGLNLLPLSAIVLANILLFVAMTNLADFSVSHRSVQDLYSFIPAGMSFVIIGVLNGLVSADIKARIVFWRWSNPLPGSRAFSDLALRDDRIDLERLRSNVGSFPDSPRDQNSTWYRLFKSVEALPEIRQNHKSYLLFRDYAFISLLCLFLLGTLGFLIFPTMRLSWMYLGILAGQFVLVSIAARNYGNRLITTVLAIKSTELQEIK